MIRNAALAGLCFVLGCGNDHASVDAATADDLLPGLNLPSAPTNGMRIISPIVHGLEPGSSHELCTWTGIKLDSTVDIKKVVGYQAVAGHHIGLFATRLEVPAGTQRECTDADMASWRSIVVIGAEGLGGAVTAPGNLVYEAEAGFYLTLQEHYINSGDNTVDSQSVLDLNYADPGGTYIPSHSIAIVNTTLDLKPGPDSLDIHCVMQQDVKAWQTLPHMHEWGTSYTATVTHATTPTTMVDHLPWLADYMFHPPTQTWDPAAPFMLRTGDSIDVHCEWNNNTSADLMFGQEMCVFYAQTVDDIGMGNVACDAGSWGAF